VRGAPCTAALTAPHPPALHPLIHLLSPQVTAMLVAQPCQPDPDWHQRQRPLPQMMHCSWRHWSPASGYSVSCPACLSPVSHPRVGHLLVATQHLLAG
jgi:hypothetical protein